MFLFVGLAVWILACWQAADAQNIPSQRYFPGVGTPADPKVSIAWNRYYDSEALADLSEQIAEAYPKLSQRVSLGKSFEGRNIWMLAITNEETGPAHVKPAIYIDGNIHSNEIQASEVVLYMAWYLTESYESSLVIRRLLDSAAFFIVPTTNPDGRNHYMRQPNTMHSPRSGVMPSDDDRDGAWDEDGPDDLNNDGHINYMRRRSATGRFRENPSDPRQLVPVAPGEQGHWEILGFEGLDNDGDGDVNEDGLGYQDPNRDWGWWWQPSPIQQGAYRYPFSLPETRAVADFIRRSPNILVGLTYHNTGGMMLIGPGAPEDLPSYKNADTVFYDFFGNLSEQLLPGYRYINTYEDLYTVYGGQSDWMYGAQGILAYTPELWTPYMLFHQESKGFFGNDSELYAFDRKLLFEQAIMPWTPYNHPQYGLIDVGGYKKTFTRNHPGFQIEEEAHRQFSVAMAMARELPRLHIGDPGIMRLEDGLYQITVEVRNTAFLPTHLARDAAQRISRPNVAELQGAQVLAGAVMTNPDLNLSEIGTRGTGSRLVAPPVPGHGKIVLRWVAQASGPVKVVFDSPRGKIERSFSLSVD